MITTLNLPIDYDFVEPGLNSIKHECPWMVPEAINFLSNNLKKDWSVLEVGAGGSSIFFGRRCRTVTALENSEPYYKTLLSALSEKNGTENIELRYVATEEILQELENLNDKYDVISIDHGVHKPSRSDCLDTVLNKWSGAMFIFDNWSKKPAWPKHHKLSTDQLKERHPAFIDCDFFDFTHNKWAGSGTRIAINKEHKC